jgi:predicted nuclease of predicted toxin-antitoxin system
MNILVDMNLSPAWVPVLAAEGWNVIHWSSIGDPRAVDATLMAWAKDHRHVVLTHDLDFGAILAVTRASGPSVIQIRAQDIMPAKLAPKLIPVLRAYESQLAAGALIVIDEARSRVRILPIG